MSKEIYISSTPHETRLAIVENEALTEIYYERENEYTLAGSIYNGKVTRVLPGMQSSFVDIGLERDAFLYITDFMEEAADSADFDTNGDSSRRRNDRNNGAPTLEGASASPSDQAADNGSGNDRNGRGDRNRGRGRRDRGGNRDRQPLSDTPVDAASDAPDFNRDDFATPTDLSSESVATSRTDEADPGEGAPGADVTRRWRGRRGRRRGRGPRDESQTAGTQTAANQTPGTEDEPLYEAPGDQDDDSFDIDGAAAPETAAIASAHPSSEVTGDVQDNTSRNDRNRGNGRGDRNNRGGRDRNRDNRGDRGAR